MQTQPDKAQRALALSKAKEVEFGAAFSEALAGDAAVAQATAQDLRRRYPEDSSTKFYYVPALHALAALTQHKPLKAIQLLQVSVPYELGEPQSCFFGFFGVMYPVYVRGLAYLALGQNAKAAREFQKIVDRPEIVVSDPVGVMARLQLGRAYLAARDVGKANASYDNFLSLWKDADAGIPVLLKARSEYGRM